MKTNREIRMLLAAGIVAGGLGVPVIAAADDTPLSHVASPGNYKVLAEDKLFRVVLATWQPGQRDVFHSHPANAVYRLNDCKNRVYGPDGKPGPEREIKAGSAVLQEPITSHSIENTGTTVCQSIIVERK